MTQKAWILGLDDQHHVHRKHFTSEATSVIHTQVLRSSVVQPSPVGTVLEL